MRNTLPRHLALFLLILLAACNAQPLPIQAEHGANAPGTPHSLDFGYGARLDINNGDIDSFLFLTAQMNLDWVALDFDWDATQPAPGQWNGDSSFSNAIQRANALGLATLVSVKNPPAWALTHSGGPDAEKTANLVLTLCRQHPNLAALELLPGANTRSGWGAAPNARNYAHLFETVQAHLDAENVNVYLVAGGLSNALSSPEDARDVDFLGKLYAAGLRPAIIGIRLDNLTGNPLDAPSPGNLRHYENIRAVMTANNHNDGLLWITGISLPAETQEETWLKQAYQMMQSQLYLGTVFYTPRSQSPFFDFRLSQD